MNQRKSEKAYRSLQRIKNIKLLNCTIAQIGLGTINPICPGLKILLLQL